MSRWIWRSSLTKIVWIPRIDWTKEDLGWHPRGLVTLESQRTLPQSSHHNSVVLSIHYPLAYSGALVTYMLSILTGVNLNLDPFGVFFLVIRALRKKGINVTPHLYDAILCGLMSRLMSHCRFFGSCHYRWSTCGWVCLSCSCTFWFCPPPVKPLQVYALRLEPFLPVKLIIPFCLLLALYFLNSHFLFCHLCASFCLYHISHLLDVLFLWPALPPTISSRPVKGIDPFSSVLSFLRTLGK